MSMGSADTANWASGPRVGASARARSARAFVAARRHSALVRVLRVALIVGVVGAIVTLTTLGLYRTFGTALNKLSIGQLSIDGTKITMQKPKLTGTRQSGESYVINAAKAIQDVLKPTLVELQRIEGDIGAADHDTLHVLSSLGHYDSDKETLELSGDVRLKNSRYAVDLKSATVAFKTGDYSTKEPVTVTIEGGTSIVADSATVLDKGAHITFEGHVKTVIPPKTENSDVAKTLKDAQP